MKDLRKKLLAIGLLAIAAVAGSSGGQFDNQEDALKVPLSNVLPAKYADNASVTSYWADARHIVFCYQGYAGSGKTPPFARQGSVCEIPSGRVSRLPAFDSQTSAQNAADHQAWDFIGFSKDQKHLFAHSAGCWYDTPAVPINTPPAAAHLKWTRFTDHAPVPNMARSIPYETATPTSVQVPSVDRFQNSVGIESASVSPDRSRMAWIDTNTPPERFAYLRNHLRRFHFLHDKPAYALWISDVNGNHPHRVGIFGQTTIESFDLRWSPDEKHISCVRLMWTPETQNELHVMTEPELTVFDVDR